MRRFVRASPGNDVEPFHVDPTNPKSTMRPARRSPAIATPYLKLGPQLSAPDSRAEADHVLGHGRADERFAFEAGVREQDARLFGDPRQHRGPLAPARDSSRAQRSAMTSRAAAGRKNTE